MKKIYKYISPDILELIFSKKDYCGLKFSYPKDYNDPYELFLTIDFKQNEKMFQYPNDFRFEHAMMIRDRIKTIEKSQIK